MAELCTKKPQFLKKLHTDAITLLDDQGGVMEQDLKYALAIVVIIFGILLGFGAITLIH